MKEQVKRSLTKTITWRLTGSGATFLISWFLTSNLIVAGSIATVQIIANTILYFVHERIWNIISWGRE